MPVIRISQQTWERLKSHASPLEHTANDIVSLALDALDAARKKRAVGTLSIGQVKKRKGVDQRDVPGARVDGGRSSGSDGTRSSADSTMKWTLTDLLLLAASNSCRCSVCADNRVLAGKIIANSFDLRDQVTGQAVQGRTLSEYYCYVAAKSGDRNRQGL